MLTGDVTRRVIANRQKAAYVVEHDLMLGTYLADRIIVFDGIPAKHGVAEAPVYPQKAINAFLKRMNVTFRRDLKTGRPRANKPNSRLDKEQQSSGNYYFTS